MTQLDCIVFSRFLGCRTGTMIQLVMFVCISFNFLLFSLLLFHCLFPLPPPLSCSFSHCVYITSTRFALNTHTLLHFSSNTLQSENVIGILCSTTTKETQNKTRLIEKAEKKTVRSTMVPNHRERHTFDKTSKNE